MVLILKIIHINDIRRRGFLAGKGLKKFREHIGTAKIGRTSKEDIVARTADVQGQFQRGKGAGLGWTAAAIARDGAAVFPRDALGRPAGAELFRGERGDGAQSGHGVSL